MSFSLTLETTELTSTLDPKQQLQMAPEQGLGRKEGDSTLNPAVSPQITLKNNENLHTGTDSAHRSRIL